MLQYTRLLAWSLGYHINKYYYYCFCRDSICFAFLETTYFSRVACPIPESKW